MGTEGTRRTVTVVANQGIRLSQQKTGAEGGRGLITNPDLTTAQTNGPSRFHELETKPGKRFIGFGHAVYIVTTFHRTARFQVRIVHLIA